MKRIDENERAQYWGFRERCRQLRKMPAKERADWLGSTPGIKWQEELDRLRGRLIDLQRHILHNEGAKDPEIAEWLQESCDPVIDGILAELPHKQARTESRVDAAIAKGNGRENYHRATLQAIDYKRDALNAAKEECSNAAALKDRLAEIERHAQGIVWQAENLSAA